MPCGDGTGPVGNGSYRRGKGCSHHSNNRRQNSECSGRRRRNDECSGRHRRNSGKRCGCRSHQNRGFEDGSNAEEN